MKKTHILAAVLFLSQCAAIEYELTSPSTSDVAAAQAVLDATDSPQKTDRTLPALSAMVTEVADTLRSVLPPFCTYLKSSDCTFTVQIVSNPTANAFVDEEGHIYLTLDLLQHVENTDEVAAVIAHEIAHHLNGDNMAKSGAIKMRQMLRYELGGGSPSSAPSRNSSGAHYLIKRETSADTLAAYILTHAGYDLTKAEAMLIKLALLSDADSRTKLATHPLNAERLAVWRNIAAEIDNNPSAMPALKD